MPCPSPLVPSSDSCPKALQTVFGPTAEDLHFFSFFLVGLKYCRSGQQSHPTPLCNLLKFLASSRHPVSIGENISSEKKFQPAVSAKKMEPPLTTLKYPAKFQNVLVPICLKTKPYHAPSTLTPPYTGLATLLVASLDSFHMVPHSSVFMMWFQP